MSKSKVIIFIGTYNGQNYLANQLDSIASQTHKNWELWVSDDGSIDDTCQILKDYQKSLGDDTLFIKSGPSKGFAANFLSLVCKTNAVGDYYAYADQDDIWESNKIQCAIDWLDTIPLDRPALYCSRTKLVDENMNDIGYSTLFKKQPGFLNALVQNIGGGNTMVFNHSALSLLRAANVNILFHDWWTYLLVSGAGGSVFYDACSAINYRQHNSNLIGGNSGWYARLQRIKMLCDGKFKKWIDNNCEALLSVQHMLTEENRFVLNEFLSARDSRLIPRMIKIRRLGIYRQTYLGNIGLIIGTLLKKI